MKAIILPTLLTSALILSGCVSTTSRERLKQSQLHTEAQLTTAFATAIGAQAIAAGSPELAQPAIDRIAVKDGEVASVYRAIDSRLREVERMQGDVLKSVTSVGAVLGVACPSAASAFTYIGQYIKNAHTSVDLLNQKQADTSNQLQQQLAAVQRLEAERRTLEARVAEDSETIKGLKAELSLVSQRIGEKVAALPSEIQAKAKDAILEELRNQGVTREQLENFSRMSASELVGLAGGGGAVGLAALAALFRTFGPSRGQKEIDEIWEDLSSAKQRMAAIASLEAEYTAGRQRQEQLQTELARLKAIVERPPAGSG